MNTRTLTFVLFFAALMLAPRIVEPAYYGYLVAFAILLVLQGHWNAIPTDAGFRLGAPALGFACTVLVIFGVTFGNSPELRDLLRDIGALFAFFVGRHLFVAYRDEGLQSEVLHALSAVGVVVAIATLFAAALAWQAGVSAYIWRGEYVPFAHSWLPYALITNVFLIDAEPQHAHRYVLRAVLCVVGTIASLSRTDLVLELLLGFALAYRFRRQIFTRITGFTKLMVALAILAVIVPLLMRLQVVQQRVEAGVGVQDASLGWRFMEHVALLEHFQNGTAYDALHGFGLGARLPLPPGVVDFNDNTSIPHLHNSFGTIALKFGILGLAFLAWYLWRIWQRSFSMRSIPGEAYRRTGRWIVLLCLGKALTLQALSEWSHLIFFGIGCMLMLGRPSTAFRLAAVRRGERSALVSDEQ